MRLVALLLVMLFSSVAVAEDRDKARELYREGTQHYNLGEFPEALKAFKDAYRNFEDPIFLFNIAQTQRQLSQRADAIRTYRAYLRESPTAPNREQVNRLITILEAELQQENVSKSIQPQGTLQPPLAAKTPEPAPKPVVAAVAKPPEPKPVVVEPKPVVVEPKPAVVEPNATEQPRVEAVVTAPPPEKKTPVYKKWWLWTIVGGVAVAGVAIGVGVALSPSPGFPATMPTDGTFRF